MSEKENKDIYTTVEVAEILSITRKTLNSYITEKKIKAFKIGNEWRITRESLDAFIEKNSSLHED